MDNLLGLQVYPGKIVGQPSVEGLRLFAGATLPPPVEAVATDPYFDKVSLLLTLTDDLKDHGPLGFSVVNIGSAAINAGELSINGSNQCLRVGADQAFSFGGGNFTLEGVVTFSVLPVNGIDGVLISKWADTGSEALGEFFLYYNGTQLGFDFRGVGVGYQSVKSAAVAIPLNTPTYFAVSRNGSTWTFNVGGNISTASNSAAIKVEVDWLEIGAIISDNVTEYTQCRLNNIRITKGQARVITTVPTRSFPTAWDQPDNPRDRLLWWWDFNEPSDNNVVDRMGRYPLTLYGSSSSVAGVQGTARALSGSDGDYFINNDWVFRGGQQPLYLFLRARFYSFSGSPSFYGRYAFDSNNRSYMFQISPSGILNWIISNNGLSGAGAIGVATWHTQLAVDPWYVIEAFVNPPLGQMGVAVNGADWVVSSHSGGLFNGLETQPFSLNRMNLYGSAYNTGAYADFDQSAAWRKPPTPALRALVWNGGAGSAFPGM